MTAYGLRISDWSSDVCSSDLCGADPRDAHPVVPVSEHGDGHLERQRSDAHQRDEGEDALRSEAEVLADLGEQDPERRPIELIDRVEAEQHDDGEDRPLPDDGLPPSRRLPHRRGAAPPNPGPPTCHGPVACPPAPARNTPTPT